MIWYDPGTRVIAEFFDKLGAEVGKSRTEIFSDFLESVARMKEAERTKSDSTPKVGPK